MKKLSGFRAPCFEVQADTDGWLVGLACCPNEVDGERQVTVVRYYTSVTKKKTLKQAVATAEKLNAALLEAQKI